MKHRVSERVPRGRRIAEAQMELALGIATVGGEGKLGRAVRDRCSSARGRAEGLCGGDEDEDEASEEEEGAFPRRKLSRRRGRCQLLQSNMFWKRVCDEKGVSVGGTMPGSRSDWAMHILTCTVAWTSKDGIISREDGLMGTEPWSRSISGGQSGIEVCQRLAEVQQRWREVCVRAKES